jgi:hypothetical protein
MLTAYLCDLDSQALSYPGNEIVTDRDIDLFTGRATGTIRESPTGSPSCL